MKIIVTDCDHDKMVQEEEVFAKAGMTFTHLACKTEDDLIRQAKAEMGREDARVVATGGLARFIAGHTPLIDVVDGELILDGLRMIYERRQT